MKRTLSLDAYLIGEAGGSELLHAVAAAVRSLVAAAGPIAERIARGALGGDLARVRSQGLSGGGDEQKELDVLAHGACVKSLREAPVAYVLSEEQELPLTLDAAAPLAVAIDPLDGSSNINANVSIGTLFSILPALSGVEPATHSFLQTGSVQLAAGFIVYGPQVSLALSLGAGTSLFVMDPHSGQFIQIAHKLRLPARTAEFAINASNQRHWDASIRAYVDDCIRGDSGPRGQNFNMRWVGSMVADAWRILMRGGVYLYPGDQREGYAHGRLRLIYEANPIAMLMEQAGGAATDGVQRILERKPQTLHQHTPLVFGSADEVARVGRYGTEPGHDAERSPLFRTRGLLRA